MGKNQTFEEISTEDIIYFMASDPVTSVSKKTALNYHTGLSSLWNWAKGKGIVDENIIRNVKPPKPEVREIIPYNRQDIIAILEAAQSGRFPLRDQSIILLLLDTGIRSSELCKLKLKDIHFESCKMLVMGKGDKERRLKFSEETRTALKSYLNSRGITSYKNARYLNLFVSRQNNPLNRDTLRQMLERKGDRSGVLKCHAHRFRHTFSIEFLRNGGNIYSLQKYLGHTTLDMVKRYLKIAQMDIDRDHDKASPVRKWSLHAD